MVDKKNSREIKKGKSKKTTSLPVEDPRLINKSSSRTLKNSDDELDVKIYSRTSLLFLSFMFALLLFSTIFLSRFLQNLPANPVTSIPNTPNYIVDTQQPFITPDPESNMTTPSINIIPTDTPTRIYSFPIIGTSGVNLPKNFMVGPWYDNSCQNPEDQFVLIYGVEIYGGTPPYILSFWQNGEEIFNFTSTPDLEQGKRLPFPTPIRVQKGKYVQVIISFSTETGDAKWMDDLLYPINTVCPGD